MFWALVRKDLIQHSKPLLIFASTALALPLAFAVMTGTEGDNAGYAGTVFGCLGISAPMLLGQWMIGQEKVKGTFKLLRSLPLSGVRIILTKCLFSAIICLVLVDSALLGVPAVCRLCGLAIPPPTVMLVIWTNIAAIFFVAVSMTVFTILDARIAAQVVMWVMCGFILCAGLTAKYLEGRPADLLAPRLESVVENRLLAASVGLILAGLSLAMVWIAACRFERLEWSRLEEG